LLFVRILSSIGHWAWIIISMLKLDVGGEFATAYANLICWGKYLMGPLGIAVENGICGGCWRANSAHNPPNNPHI
jgi:hypothetical protein